jgi:N-carbamoylputrescine amidase
MDTLIIAAVIMHSQPGDLDFNLERTRFWVRKAAKEGARVVLFPEASLTGYLLSDKRIAAAQALWGEAGEALQALARETRVLILAGMIESGDPDLPYLTQVAVAPEGVLGAYRKIHLGLPEKGLYKAGGEVAVFDWQGTSIGVQICFDGHFPELSTLQALKGAEVLFFPHASPRETPIEKRDRWLMYLRARAYDNSVFVAAVNAVGRGERDMDLPGVAFILGPKGEILGELTTREEGLLIAHLDGEALREIRRGRKGFFLSHRRPKLYGPLSEDINH